LLCAVDRQGHEGLGNNQRASILESEPWINILTIRDRRNVEEHQRLPQMMVGAEAPMAREAQTTAPGVPVQAFISIGREPTQLPS
jgi:hypothetical protein